MFADLNRHARSASQRHRVLYDHRDDDSGIARLVVMRSDFFRGVVEMERSSLGPITQTLHALALYNATQSLFAGLQYEDLETAANKVVTTGSWSATSSQYGRRCGRAEYQQATSEPSSSTATASHCTRSDGRGTHSCRVKNRAHGSKAVEGLSKIDWSRANVELWEAVPWWAAESRSQATTSFSPQM